METIPIPASRNISDVEYDEDERELYITFNYQSARYLYRGVDATTAHGFEHAPSAHTYLKLFIESAFIGERVG